MSHSGRSVALLIVLSSLGVVQGAEAPSFTQDATVHDPSVIKVGDRFYVYGSHGASAWTTDLMNWTQVATSISQGNPVHFPNVATELADLRAWCGVSDLWAPDVFEMPDGRYYYYYYCLWANVIAPHRGYLGVAVSDTIEGPYHNLGEIKKTGEPGYNASVDPNTIDPCLFRDTTGQLWMVYGSYSGGIFILRMEDSGPNIGFQEPGQGWGTYLMAGNHAPIEGPFVEYNPQTDSYYLFLSYGGLAANDGYNMRVFRSQYPDGPYYDPDGNNMELIGRTASWRDYGLKLAGNWQFLPVDGESATTTVGYKSPGHNSVIYDETTGKWLNFFHTRFVGRGEVHEVRVHQLFFNEDGWPVMNPHRYAGETIGRYSVDTVSGGYKVINHGKDVTGVVKTSTQIALNVDGSLGGASGDWSMPTPSTIHITLDGVTYKGVVCRCWDNENRLWVNAFSAVSTDGVTVWGSEVALPLPSPRRPGGRVPPGLDR
jgi:arabinan endo-1,5-alpha-L-arabinosidase